MSLNLRRLIAILFFLFFFVAVPPLIMVTSGYLYSIKKNKFEKTGLLIISTKPAEASILLNNQNPRTWWSNYIPLLKEKEFHTPTRINYLLPNKYPVKTILDGYHDWEANIDINGGDSVILENIILYPKALPIKITNNDKISLLLKDITTADNTNLLNIDNHLILEEVILPLPDNSTIKNIIKSDDRWIYVNNQKNDLWRFNINNSSWQILGDNLRINNLFFDDKNNIVWWWKDFEIGNISLKDNKVNLINRFSEKIVSIKPHPDDELGLNFIIATTNTLRALDGQLDGQPILTEVFKLPNITNILIDSSDFFIIETGSEEKIYWEYSLKN